MASLAKAFVSSNPHQTIGLMTNISDNYSIGRRKKVENGRGIITTKKMRDHGNIFSERYSNLVLCSQMRTNLTTTSSRTAVSQKQIGSLFLTSPTPVTFAAIAMAAASTSDHHSPAQPPSSPPVSVDEVDCYSVESVLALPLAPVNVLDPSSVETATIEETDVKAQASKATRAVKSAISTSEKEAKKLRTSATLNRPKMVKKERNPKYLRNDTPPLNKIDLYQMMKYPLLTESAIKCIADDNTLVFIVDIKADKKMIRSAIKTMYGIQTQKVNTSIRPDGTKKAFVKLAPHHNASDLANKIGIF